MKVLMLRNPASSVGCLLQEGQIGNVPDNMGRTLVAAGLARCLDEPKPEPKAGTVEKATADFEEYRLRALRAIPEKPIEAVPPKPAIGKTSTESAPTAVSAVESITETETMTIKKRRKNHGRSNVS